MQRKVIATIGFFDGVHEGHKFVISQLVQLAKETGGQPIVVTFRNHPAALFCPERQPKLLTTPDEKREKILACGADVIMLDFNHQLAEKTAAEFITLLKTQHNVTHLLLGYDNRFGKKSPDNPETFQDYQRIGASIGVEIIKLKPYINAIKPYSNHPPTSSTIIRNLLQQGALGAANQRLGYHYHLQGTVTAGHQIGRKIGFPTANLKVSDNKLTPQSGVYAVTVTLPEEQHPHLAMLNIGHRPTFDGHETTIEVHILDFQANLYGKTLRLEFLKRIREEKKFQTPQQLIQQLTQDRETIRNLFPTA